MADQCLTPISSTGSSTDSTTVAPPTWTEDPCKGSYDCDRCFSILPTCHSCVLPTGYRMCFNDSNTGASYECVRAGGQIFRKGETCPPPPTVVYDTCGVARTCDECRKKESCGWCDLANSCFNTTNIIDNRSPAEYCVAKGGQWDICPQVSSTTDATSVRCEGLVGCDTCNNQNGACYYCWNGTNSRCMYASAAKLKCVSPASLKDGTCGVGAQEVYDAVKNVAPEVIQNTLSSYVNEKQAASAEIPPLIILAVVTQTVNEMSVKFSLLGNGSLSDSVKETVCTYVGEALESSLDLAAGSLSCRGVTLVTAKRSLLEGNTYEASYEYSGSSASTTGASTTPSTGSSAVALVGGFLTFLSLFI